MATTFKMHLYALFLIQLGCCINIIPSQAQTTYAVPNYIPPKLFNFDMNSCTSTEIGTLEALVSGYFGPEGGLALCPDGSLYLTSYGELFSVETSTGYSTSVPGIPVLPFHQAGLACSGNGILYSADEWIGNNNLYKIDLNTTTVTILGQTPYSAASEMFFHNGSLYMFSVEGLVLVDTITPANSTLLFNLPPGVYSFGATAFETCNMVLIYTNVGQFSLFSLLDGTMQPYCNSPFGYWVAISSTSEFNQSGCTPNIDLDQNNSSGADDPDYNSNEFTCLTIEGVPVADEDVLIMTGTEISEMTVTLNSAFLPDLPDEILDITTSISNIDVTGAGGTMITLTNAGGARIQDFLDALHSIVYFNLAPEPTEGYRSVDVQFTTSDGLMSNIATAFLDVVQLPHFLVDLGPDIVECDGETVIFNAGNPGASYLWSSGHTTQTITTGIANQYSVTVSDGIFCPTADTILLDIIPAIEVAITGDTEICDDETASLTIHTNSPFPLDIELILNPGLPITLTGITGDYSFTEIPLVSTEYIINTVTSSQPACIEIADSSQSINVHPTYQIDQEFTMCDGDSIWLGYYWVTSAGFYGNTFPSVNGCDSSIITVITIEQEVMLFVESVTCDPTLDGVYIEYFDNPNGCDTIVETTINLLSPDTTLISLFTCRSNETALLIDTLTNVSGCDSLIITTISYTPPADTTFFTDITCDSANLGTSYTTLTNLANCDSIVAIAMSYGLTDTTYLFGTSCNPNEIGLFETLITDTQGCDSLVIRTVTQGIPDSSYVFLTSCDSSNLGVFETSYLNQQGCDSTVFTTISFSESDSSFITTSSCDPDDVGEFISTYINQFGCDSIVTQTILLSASHNIMLPTSSCNPADTGVFVQNLTNQFGCDSIVTEIIEYSISHDINISSGTCIESNTGVFIHQLLNQYGCDSIITETISLVDVDTTVLQSYTCDAGMTGLIETMYITSEGCDSLVIDITSLFPLPQLEIIATIDFNGFDVSCMGANDGAVHVNVDGVAPFQYLWSTSSMDQNITGLSAGNYSIAVTDGNGCMVTGEIILIEPEQLMISFIISQPDCFEKSSGSIEVAASGGAQPYAYSINGSPYQSQPSFKGLQAGLYQLTARDANECEVSELILIKEPIEVQVELGNDQSILPGDTIIMQAMVNISIDSISSVTWTGIEPSNCIQCLTQTVVPIFTTSYSIEVVSVDGCSDSDEITLFMDHDKDVYVPNIFSPNGDGINDVLRVSAGRDVNEILSFVIYDRWGNMIFSADHFQADDQTWGWDGTLNDKLINPGVFTYRLVVIFKDGTSEVKYGDITLIR